jgi:hypothetical protein
LVQYRERLIGKRPRIPVGEQEHRRLGLGAETRQEVDQRQRITFDRHMGEPLDDQRVGSFPEVRFDPLRHRSVTRASRDARPEGDLALDERVGRRAIKARVGDGRGASSASIRFTVGAATRESRERSHQHQY